MTDRAAILSALATKPEAHVVEGVGTFHFREMSVAERNALARLVFGADNKREISSGEWAAHVVAMTLCDESGARVFTADDVPSIMDGSQKVLERIALIAQQVNGLESAAVEQAEKNSPPTRGGGSRSGSPSD